jgi:hypothetical protein
LVSVSVEGQLATLRRWLTALTIVTVTLAVAVFVLASSRFEHLSAQRMEVSLSAGWQCTESICRYRNLMEPDS